MTDQSNDNSRPPIGGGAGEGPTWADGGNEKGLARDQLRSLVERIERLEEEKKAIGEDIKEVYGEAKDHGFDVKTIRKLVTLRKVEASDRLEQEAILDTYMHALGMIPDLLDSEQGS